MCGVLADLARAYDYKCIHLGPVGFTGLVCHNRQVNEYMRHLGMLPLARAEVHTMMDIVLRTHSVTEFCSMWETTFPRNSHAGLGRPVYEPNILVSMVKSS